LWIAVVVAIGIGSSVYLALRPESLQKRVHEALGKLLLHPPEVGSVTFDLRDGVQINDLRIRGGDGAETILSVGRVRVALRLGSLLGSHPALERVELEDVELRLVRAASGRFNIQDILQPRPPSDPEDPVDLPDVIVSDCRVLYIDESRSFSEEIENLELSLTRDGSRVYSFDGELQQSLADRLLVSGRLLFSDSHPSVDLRVRAFKLDLARSLERLLPDEVARPLRDLDLAGSLDVEGDLSIRTLEGVVLERLAGRLIRCSLSSRGSSLAVTALGGELLVRERTLELRDLNGKVGGGTLTGRCLLELAADAGSIVGWGCKISVDGAPLDPRWVRELSPELRERIEPFRFSGTASVTVEVSDSRVFPPQLPDVVASLELDDVEIGHEDVSGSVTAIHGTVRLEGGALRVEDLLSAQCFGSGLFVTRAKIDLAGSSELDVQLRVGGPTTGEDAGNDGLLLDERVRDLLPDDLVHVWDDLNPGGRVAGTVRWHRARRSLARSQLPERPVRTVVRLFPRDVRLAYRGFPYEIERITGEVVYDSADGFVRIKGLVGHHEDMTITGSGHVDLRDDALLQVEIVCADLATSPDLLAALGERGRRAVVDFGFSGRMKTVVRIFSLPDGGMDFQATLDLLEGAVEPTNLRYPLRLSGGRMVVRGERLIEFEGVRTEEGASPSLRFDGRLTTRDHTRRLDYDIDIARLSVDERLRAGLPEKMRNFVENLGLQGTFDGHLEGYHVADASDPSRNKIHYKGSEITTRDAAVDFGPVIKGMKAKGRFVGGDSPDFPSHFWGEVLVESASFNRLELTGGDITFRFGDPHPHVLADRQTRQIEGREYRIPEAFLDRLDKSKVSHTFQMSVHSGSLYGGSIDGFLYVDTGDAGDFGGDFSARGLEVGRAAKDVFGVDGGKVAGTASGKVRFLGRTGGIGTLVGEGDGVIENAQLLEIPLFVQLLGILKLDIFQAKERKFFNEIRLPFRIGAGRFHVSDLRIKSPSLSLAGDGTMSFDGELDLRLRPRVVDVSVPVWDQIVGFVKDVFLRVKVKGDLAEPKVTVATALGLIDIPVDTSDSGAPQSSTSEHDEE